MTKLVLFDEKAWGFDRICHRDRAGYCAMRQGCPIFCFFCSDVLFYAPRDSTGFFGRLLYNVRKRRTGICDMI